MARHTENTFSECHGEQHIQEQLVSFFFNLFSSTHTILFTCCWYYDLTLSQLVKLVCGATGVRNLIISDIST